MSDAPKSGPESGEESEQSVGFPPPGRPYPGPNSPFGPPHSASHLIGPPPGWDAPGWGEPGFLRSTSPFDPPAHGYGFPPPPAAPEANKKGHKQTTKKQKDLSLGYVLAAFRKPKGKRRQPTADEKRGIVIYAATIVPRAFLETYVQKKLYNWFVPQAFGVKPINGAQATGLNIVSYLFFPRPAIKLAKRGEYPSSADAVRQVRVAFWLHVGALITGFIAKELLSRKESRR